MEKGTQGIDCRVVSPKSKGRRGKASRRSCGWCWAVSLDLRAWFACYCADVRAFVICLGRAGEDNKSFVLRDTDSTFAGFAGADYNLQV